MLEKWHFLNDKSLFLGYTIGFTFLVIYLLWFFTKNCGLLSIFIVSIRTSEVSKSGLRSHCVAFLLSKTILWHTWSLVPKWFFFQNMCFWKFTKIIWKLNSICFHISYIGNQETGNGIGGSKLGRRKYYRGLEDCWRPIRFWK